jgi:hypothetical protein
MKKKKAKKRATPKKPAFLAAYRVTCSVTRAAEAVGIERQMHYRWLREDPEYPALFNAAHEEATQGLEDDAVERARQGTEEPVIYKGSLCYAFRIDANGQIMRAPDGMPLFEKEPLKRRKRSDSLLIELLRANRPQKFRSNASVEISGPEGGPIDVTDKRLASLTDEELAAFIAVAKKMGDQPE